MRVRLQTVWGSRVVGQLSVTVKGDVMGRVAGV